MAQPPPPPAGAIPAHVLNAPQFAFHVMTTKYPRNGPGPVAGVGGPAPPEPAAGDPLRIIYMFPEQQDGYVQGVFSPDAIKDYRPNINPTGPFNAQVEAIRQWVYAWETSVPVRYRRKYLAQRPQHCWPSASLSRTLPLRIVRLFANVQVQCRTATKTKLA